MKPTTQTPKERIEMFAGGWTAILGHEVGAAPDGSNMADMIESAMRRACRQAWNDAINAALKECADESQHGDPDDYGVGRRTGCDACVERVSKLAIA